MADIPIAGKGSESPSSGSPTDSLRRSRSMVSLRLTGASILQVFPDGSTTTLSRRSGSPLESPRSPKSQRTSFNGREDLDDPIKLFSLIPCAADCSQETIVPPSIPGESTLDPGDTHHPGDSTPKALTTSLPPSLPPSCPLTPPSASAEAAAVDFITPPVSQYMSTIQRTPLVTNSPAVNQMALDGPKGDTSPQADVREPAILVPGTPPSQPPSRNVSQIPTLPVNLLDVPLSFRGKDSAAANIILATIIKAGGKAQTSMTEGPSTNHGLRIIGQLVAETAQGLEALADAAIAHTDRDVYRQLTEAAAQTPAGQTLKATPLRNPAPKPQPPPKPTVQPATPKPAQAPNPTSKGISAPPAPTQPLPSFNWDDDVQREQDGDTPMGPPPIVDLADFIDIPPETNLAPEAGDDGFTRVEKGKGKAHCCRDIV
ncbi:hypothetical protein FRC06_011287 [Ceratobasidium sp. 370]|nr:hypothetical protein FRC06_011287 [Ceratobasidium sp. 370]